MKEAMIFAAGIGSRLKPITDTIPKALVKINGITALERSILSLLQVGVEKIIINIHHHPEQIKNFLQAKNNFGIEIIISDETDLLLDTGGGLKFAEKHFSKKEPFVLHNADILSNININELYEQFKKDNVQGNTLATLAIQNRAASRYFLFSEENILVGYGKDGEDKIYSKIYEQKVLGEAIQPHKYGFTGVHVVSPDIFQFIQNGVFSIRDTYLQLAAKEEKITGYNCDKNFWFDIGSIEKLNQAELFYKENSL